MGLKKEYRILLPFTVEEYERGFTWAMTEDLKKNNIIIEKNEPFIDDKSGRKGEFIRRLISNSENTPSLVKKLAPEGSLDMIEERWDSYPHIKSVLKNGYMGEKMKITIHSVYKQDAGTAENPHGLPEGENVEIAFLDFLNTNEKIPTNDPTQFCSKTTGRGNLTSSWVTDALDKNGDQQPSGKTFGEVPVMCIYILVEVNFNVFGMQRMMENTLHEQMCQAQIKHSRLIFCNIDSWHSLSLSEIKAQAVPAA